MTYNYRNGIEFYAIWNLVCNLQRETMETDGSEKKRRKKRQKGRTEFLTAWNSIRSRRISGCMHAQSERLHRAALRVTGVRVDAISSRRGRSQKFRASHFYAVPLLSTFALYLSLFYFCFRRDSVWTYASANARDECIARARTRASARCVYSAYTRARVRYAEPAVFG